MLFCIVSDWVQICQFSYRKQRGCLRAFQTSSNLKSLSLLTTEDRPQANLGNQLLDQSNHYAWRSIHATQCKQFLEAILPALNQLRNLQTLMLIVPQQCLHLTRWIPEQVNINEMCELRILNRAHGRGFSTSKHHKAVVTNACSWALVETSSCMKLHCFSGH